MLCARVMRGISSIERSVTPVARNVADRLRSSERIGEADDRLAGAQRPFAGGTARTCRRMSVVWRISARDFSVAPCAE